eukprot:Blabericola_migrator_1__1379@NODE_1359_length_4725_cov_105_142121_g912_i0_p4_GENE_NODE_1359_length_4725_cov_105_142121_g912_i0NODE_1359_length_4725_cov_105_142121_g912_i0_p4_ORF_typecomplete_len168_score15_17_NODE_1359_length_4725_cov_105_142121_g912_i021152618
MLDHVDTAVLQRALLSKDELLLDQLLDQDVYSEEGEQERGTTCGRCVSSAARSMLSNLDAVNASELTEILTHKILRDRAAPSVTSWLRAALLQFHDDPEYAKLARPALAALRSLGESKQMALPLTIKLAKLSSSSVCFYLQIANPIGRVNRCYEASFTKNGSCASTR